MSISMMSDKTERLVIVGPNLRDQSRGEFHVHAEGCADLERDPNLRSADRFTVSATSGEEVAEIVYGDQIAESGDMASDYLGEFHFAPCVLLEMRTDNRDERAVTITISETAAAVLADHFRDRSADLDDEPEWLREAIEEINNAAHDAVLAPEGAE